MIVAQEWLEGEENTPPNCQQLGKETANPVIIHMHSRISHFFPLSSAIDIGYRGPVALGLCFAAAQEPSAAGWMVSRWVEEP